MNQLKSLSAHFFSIPTPAPKKGGNEVHPTSSPNQINEVHPTTITIIYNKEEGLVG